MKKDKKSQFSELNSPLSRRQFWQYSSAMIGGMSILGSAAFSQGEAENSGTDAEMLTMIGPYGEWATGLTEKNPLSLSFADIADKDTAAWSKTAREAIRARLAIPDIGPAPEASVDKTYTYDGLHVEELSWQLPYGRPTKAILLKPESAKGKLPAVLAFHDHGGNKYFGCRKITRTADKRHPLIEYHQEHYYEGRAWANELARRGYVVLVSDAFPFASRRVWLKDVPKHLRIDIDESNPESPEYIKTYNKWAGDHESIMAKSLLCAGTTWPGVFLGEDLKALDILSARDDVDSGRIGCGGLSGGGMRTAFAGGLDSRIKCAVCVGFMSTWRDFLLYKTYIHTWMVYVPLLPNELDFPEILASRVPLPTMVLNDKDDILYTLPEMQRADRMIADIYRAASAEDKYRCSYYPGPHKFDIAMQEEAFDWYDKWLKI